MGSRSPAAGSRSWPVHTPGHTSDHVAFFVASAGALFTGDAVLGRGTSFIDPPDGDLAQYLRSLRRMRDLAPRTSIRDTDPWCSMPRRSWTSTCAIREEREREVVDALAGGSATIAALVETIYVAYPDDVHPLAARSVLAHLLKLETEGRVQRTGKGEDARYSVSVPRSCARCGNPVKGRATLCGPCSLAVLQEGSSATPEKGAG